MISSSNKLFSTLLVNDTEVKSVNDEITLQLKITVLHPYFLEQKERKNSRRR